MTIHPEPTPDETREVTLEGVPDQEGISEADAAQRVDQDPEEVPNATEPHGGEEVR